MNASARNNAAATVLQQYHATRAVVAHGRESRSQCWRMGNGHAVQHR